MEIISQPVEEINQVERLNALPPKLRTKARNTFLVKVEYSERTMSRRVEKKHFTPEESKILKDILDNLKP